MAIGWSEIIVIVLVVLLLFGSKRIPELARALGKASHEFKRAKESILKEGEELMDEAEHAAAAEETEKSSEDKKNG